MYEHARLASANWYAKKGWNELAIFYQAVWYAAYRFVRAESFDRINTLESQLRATVFLEQAAKAKLAESEAKVRELEKHVAQLSEER